MNAFAGQTRSCTEAGIGAKNASLGAKPKWLALAQWFSFAVSFAILWMMCKGVFGWLVGSVFNEPREDMAHGWFIPLFTIALFWLKRHELRKVASTPSACALLLAIPGIALFLIGILGEQVRFSLVAAIWLVWVALYVSWGWRLAKESIFAVSFLLFTMPMSFLDVFTVKLRILIAAIASTLLNGLGIAVVRTGTGLRCLADGGFNLDIADPCSGMRSIFALTALTAAYAYLTQKTLRGKWLLFLCSIPLAMLGNLVRIFSIAIVATIFGQQVATGFYHDYSGYITFLVAVLAMVAVGEMLSRWLERGLTITKPSVKFARASSVKASWLSIIPLMILPVALLLAESHIRHAPAPVLESDSFIVDEMPELDGYVSRIPYFCQNENCMNVIECGIDEPAPEKCPRCGAAMDKVSLGERTVLPKDTRFVKCNYYDMLGNGWKVSIIVNGRSRQSIHRPEICLPAQGWSIEKGHIEEFDIGNGQTLAMHCMDVRPRTSSSGIRMGHGYFFINARQRAASHARRILISVRDRVFARRVVRWAMVTVSAEEALASTPRRREQTAEFLSALLPKITTIEFKEKGKRGENVR